MKKRILFKSAIALLVLALAVSACGKATVAPANTPAPPPTETPVPTATPTTVPTATPPPTPTATPEPALPPEPQEIAFQAADGQELHGLYYPAARLNAPLVVLIHWVASDQSDWYEIAPWLQNRGLANPFPNPGTEPWWDPSWFPHMPEGVSYGVFAFSLRTCTPFPEGCQQWLGAAWYPDVQAAMQKATELEGVDPTRIVVIGSSVGADGAADGCQWLNQESPDSCQGALSLSPGDYLEIPYADVVQDLCEQQQPKAVWCLADAANEVQFCEQAGEYPTYQVYGIRDGGHGNDLLRPNLDPLPMQLILDFLKEALNQ